MYMKNILESCHFLSSACSVFDELFSQVDITNSALRLWYYGKSSALESSFLIHIAPRSVSADHNSCITSVT